MGIFPFPEWDEGDRCLAEVKVVFKEEDDIIRVLRGIIEKEDDFFIYLKRNDANYRINKRFIIKIEEEKDGRI